MQVGPVGQAGFAAPAAQRTSARVGEFQAFQFALALGDTGEGFGHQARSVFGRGFFDALRIAGDAAHGPFEVPQLQPDQSFGAGGEREVLLLRGVHALAAVGSGDHEQRDRQHHGQSQPEREHGRGGLRSACRGAGAFGGMHRVRGCRCTGGMSLFGAPGRDNAVSALRHLARCVTEPLLR